MVIQQNEQFIARVMVKPALYMGKEKSVKRDLATEAVDSSLTDILDRRFRLTCFEVNDRQPRRFARYSVINDNRCKDTPRSSCFSFTLFLELSKTFAHRTQLR